MNKSLVTHLVAGGLFGVGMVVDMPASDIVRNTGLFALAGGVTNWLAVHMLFEKVPGLYGSGIVSARFADFKAGIHGLIMEQFFSRDNLDRFFAEMVHEDDSHRIDFSEVIAGTDLAPAFDGLVATVMDSSFGSMLSMFGGGKALASLREPFDARLRQALDQIAHGETFQASLRDKLTSTPVSEDVHAHIEQIVQDRLDALTPQMVKDIIQTMIRQHLGWLVVWGGVFGGLIGFSSSFLPL